ncbi:bone morphogenetic protein 1-like [Uloborus diversus]|uniref:bone morphogenetic protein 1-like n=1 Tax=Uloborus diversus TaxID=327109 RepID=UPI00240A02B3|nr:bone morphogenetic protein 1-like [Uloborus diversus]
MREGRPLVLLTLVLVRTAGGLLQETHSHPPTLVSQDLDMDPGKADLFEGDIIVDRVSSRDPTFLQDLRRTSLRHRRKGNWRRHARRRKGRAATARTDRLWPHAVIPYEIEANFSGKYR